MAEAVAGPISMYKITTNYIEKMYIIIKISKNLSIKAPKQGLLFGFVNLRYKLLRINGIKVINKAC